MAALRQRLAEHDARRAKIAALLAGGLPEPATSPTALQQQLDAVAALRVCLMDPIVFFLVLNTVCPLPLR